MKTPSSQFLLKIYFGAYWEMIRQDLLALK